MENKINIAELLEDCPKGMELDCTMYDDITLVGVDDMENTIFPIRVLRKDGCSIALTKYGQYADADYAKCVIYPKGKTTWKGFQIPFKDGDVVFSGVDLISIYKEQIGGHFGRLHSHVSLSNSNIFAIDGDIWALEGLRLATEEEKKKLFDAIKENGYKWNPETKTLETLTKFKVGNRIRFKKNHNYTYTITDIREKENKYECGKTFVLRFSEQDDWELVPNKFDVTTLKPFDKVLMRSSNAREWVATFYSHYSNNKFYGCGMCCDQCIPYEGNEHLRGTPEDCNEYFKTWK